MGKFQLHSLEFTSVVDKPDDLKSSVYVNPWYRILGSLPWTRMKQSRNGAVIYTMVAHVTI
jgi:hypothetical protein